MGYGGGPMARNLLVQDGIKLRLSDITKGRRLRAYSRFHGCLSWTRWGEEAASVRFDLTTEGPVGTVRLVYTVTQRATGEALDMDYTIGLVTTEQPAGGSRYWFWCDRGKAMVSTLHLMPGSSVFASRQAFGRPFSYRSQRVSDRDRLLEKAQAIRLQLGGSPAVFDAFPERPPGMHRSRYERMRAKGEAAGGASLAMLGQQLERSGYRDRVFKGRV